MAKKNTLPISGGKAVVECLKANNVKHVFGLIGSATMELFDALYDEKSIKFIDVRDERTGAHMADAYARASGKLGVIIAGQNGPCLLYTSPSPRDRQKSRMPSSA